MIELYNFQKQALEQASPSYFYAMDTGTGKTLTSLHHYLKYSRGEPLLIVAPPAVIKAGGWKREVERVGDNIEFEQLSYGKLSKDFEKYRNYFVIFDEAHYIKNPTSQRGKAACKLARQSTHFVLLTATPMANGWEDSINYFIMFGMARNKTQFLNKYAIYEDLYLGSRVVKKVSDFRFKEELNGMFKKISVSVSKHEALDLPEITFDKVHFEKSKEYKTIEKDLVLNDIAFDSPPKLSAGLRYFANIVDKAEYIKEMAHNTTDNIIIFYQYTKELNFLKSVLQGKTIFEVNGGCTHLPPRDTWDNLHNSVTLVQYQAGGAGIELQYANIVIYHTPTYSYQDYAQSLGRAYRNGQNRKVTVYQFETTGTIEEHVWTALENKKDFSDKIYLETRLRA
ncbi:SNF2-related protein [Lactococcus sp. dk310]|uniref:SNF2-related protein n=1 Tax=unclassified Lactococcus TaxID=2643510 RepID=UPI00351A64C3